MAKFRECTECNYKNSPDAKFCESCGHPLQQEGTGRKSKKCPSCGARNNSDARFCTQCGDVISNRQRKKIAASDSKTGWNNPFLVILIAIVGIFVFLLIANEFNSHSGNNNSAPLQTNIVLEPAVAEIAQLFKCACGSCDDPTLAHCQCPTAMEQMNTIRTLLNQNKPKAEIVAIMKNKYGHYIGENQNNSNIDAEELSKMLNSF